MLTAAWQFDCCKLFFVVFLKCWPKLRYEARTFDCEGFDIYSSRLSIDGALRGIASVPAITSASLLEVRAKQLLVTLGRLTSPGGAPSTKAETVAK
jgi:hypothetical protein